MVGFHVSFFLKILIMMKKKGKGKFVTITVGEPRVKG